MKEFIITTPLSCDEAQIHCMLLAMVVKLNLELEQMNVKTTLLKRYLKETIYMKQVEGFDEKDKNRLCL